MSIEDTQKINKLAKELLTHGIAASSQEASQRAEEMIHGKTDREQKTLQDNFEKQKEEREADPEFHLLKSTVRQLSSDLLKLSSELTSVKAAFTKLQREVASPKPVQSTVETTDEQSKDDLHNARSSYSQEDVSIEKVFYFGKK